MKKRALPLLLAVLLSAAFYLYYHREWFFLFLNSDDLFMKVLAGIALILILAIRLAWKAFLRRNPPESMPFQKDLMDEDSSN